MAGTAFDSNAVTLAEYAVDHNDPLVTSITMSLLGDFNAIEDIKFFTRDTHWIKGVRWKDKDITNFTVAHRALNDVPPVTKAKPTPYSEQAYIMAAQFQIDIYTDDENTIVDPVQMQVDGWSEAWRYAFNNWFINNLQDGSAGNDPIGPVGIRARLDNPTLYGCALNGSNADAKIDAGGFTVGIGMTQDNALDLTANIDKLLDFMGSSSGAGIVLYMNDYMKRALAWAVKKLGPAAGFTTGKDAFDRGVEYYKQAKVVDIGRTADQSTRIITATETNTGANGTSTFTSIYAVRHAKNRFTGWQRHPLKPKNLGIDPTNGSAINVVINWPYGILMPNTRAIGRLYDINLGSALP